MGFLPPIRKVNPPPVRVPAPIPKKTPKKIAADGSIINPVYVDPNHQSVQFSPYQNYNPNTNVYSNPLTGQPIVDPNAPMPEQSFKYGGLVQKLYPGGPVVPQQGNIVADGSAGYTPSWQPQTSTVVGFDSDTKRGYFKNPSSGDTESKGWWASKDARQKANIKASAQSAGALGMAATAGMNRPVDSPTSNQNDVANAEAAKGGIDAVAGSVTPWYGLAKTGSNLGKSMVDKDEYGRPKGGGNEALNEVLTPHHEQAIDSYNIEGGGLKGAYAGFLDLMGRSHLREGLDITGFGKDTEGVSGWLNDISGNTARNDLASADDAARQKIIDDKAKAEREAKMKENIANAISERDMASYAKGGKVMKVPGYSNGGVVVGPGTGKSDSVPANITAGSTVVPVENVPLAAEVTKKVLKAPIKKANLNQSGGEPVLLSAGEIVLTKDQVDKLKKAGVNMNMLAPPNSPKFARV